MAAVKQNGFALFYAMMIYDDKSIVLGQRNKI